MSRLLFLWRLLGKRERTIFNIALTLAFVAVSAILIQAYLNATEVVPEIGGSYREGTVGEPRFVNPVLAQTNDADMDLIPLIYSSLFKFDENRTLVPDLAKEYTVSEDAKTYTITLRDDATFHDGTPLTADDVLFTLSLIQNVNVGSPLYLNFLNVDVAKVDATKLTFTLPKVFAPFLANLTFGILPQHLWQQIEPQNVSLAELNLTPIGSGPYAFEKFTKDRRGTILKYVLRANPDYYGTQPYLERLEFVYNRTAEEAVEGFARGEFSGIAHITPALLNKVKDDAGITLYRMELPRYFALFFNLKDGFVGQKPIREALRLATNKEALLTAVSGEATVTHAPIPNELLEGDLARFSPYDPNRAKEILAGLGWNDSDSDGIRDQNGFMLNIQVTTTDQPTDLAVLEMLTQEWREIGVNLVVNPRPALELQTEDIKNRRYQVLFYGEVLGNEPDPYPFWHSTQVTDPGLNLSNFESIEADRILESARQLTDGTARIEKYREFSEIVAREIPALFLFNPYYIFGTSDEIRGVTVNHATIPSDRFNEISSWYSNTKRIFSRINTDSTETVAD
ncbi:MAG: peptide ABC transporter substrate-binding protein [Parcubacteria group bacterium]|nr:peptide ABC transporter substrate-binding protein [Parcubacteria group bacterium]